jgi:dolichyl-phosphate-mannose--protein O-mannosyl transferase
MSGVLIYYLARTIGADMLVSLLAGLLYIASSIAVANSRFAHNDLYLQFFSVLCIFCAIKYQLTKSKLWIYSSFFAVGLAASSKYTGGSLLLVPLFVLAVMNWDTLRKNWLQSFMMLLVGGLLSFAGYVLGTPKAIYFLAISKMLSPRCRILHYMEKFMVLPLDCMVSGRYLKMLLGCLFTIFLSYVSSGLRSN